MSGFQSVPHQVMLKRHYGDVKSKRQKRARRRALFDGNRLSGFLHIRVLGMHKRHLHQVFAQEPHL